MNQMELDNEFCNNILATPINGSEISIISHQLGLSLTNTPNMIINENNNNNNNKCEWDGDDST